MQGHREHNNMGLPEENKYIQISTYFSLFCIECNLVLFSVPHIIPANTTVTFMTRDQVKFTIL